MRLNNTWFRDNALSVVLFGLFAMCLVVQAVSGLLAFNENLLVHRRPPVRLSYYLTTGNFVGGVFSNWQAALLQLACLIVFGVSLHQKGAAHSRDPRDPPRRSRFRAPWLYRNSLSLAFWVLFAASFAVHVVFGARSYNDTRLLSGQTPIGIWRYVRTSTFWFRTTQTWQAEFFAIGVLLVLTIFLRQEGSPESKPVESSNEETGTANK
jgi:Domain of unknown function (DUF6766)